MIALVPPEPCTERRVQFIGLLVLNIALAAAAALLALAIV